MKTRRHAWLMSALFIALWSMLLSPTELYAQDGGLRAYGYVEDPLAWVDPLGLSECGPNRDASGGGAIGFAPGTGGSAFPANRLQHASRHLTDAGILPNWSRATGEQFRRIGTQIVENPTATFDHILRGGQRVRGFLGEVNGQNVAVMVFRDGPRAGQVATSVVPSASQLARWGL